MGPTCAPGLVLRRFAEGRFDAVTSAAIGQELGRAVRYEKVRTRIELTDDELELWLVSYDVLAVQVEPTSVERVVEADPADDIYVAAALEGRARDIVSGDRHLLDLGSHQDVDVVAPRTFLDRV